jgi:hypothetical protein
MMKQMITMSQLFSCLSASLSSFSRALMPSLSLSLCLFRSHKAHKKRKWTKEKEGEFFFLFITVFVSDEWFITYMLPEADHH